MYNELNKVKKLKLKIGFYESLKYDTMNQIWKKKLYYVKHGNVIIFLIKATLILIKKLTYIA